MLRKYFSNVRFSFFLPKLTVVLLCVGQICTSSKPAQWWTTSSCHRVCFICFIKERRTPVLRYCHVKAKWKQYSSFVSQEWIAVFYFCKQTRLLTWKLVFKSVMKVSCSAKLLQHLVTKLVSSLFQIHTYRRSLWHDQMLGFSTTFNNLQGRGKEFSWKFKCDFVIRKWVPCSVWSLWKTTICHSV